MVAEVFAGLSAFKTMFDIAKSMKDMDDTVKRNAAVAELWEQILSAQARYATAVEQVRDLEEKLTKFETWEAEKKRYELKELASGVSAYAIKEAVRGAEPQHYLCPVCYDQGKKSILQEEIRVPGRSQVLVCHRCGTDLYVVGEHHVEHKSYKRGPGRS